MINKKRLLEAFTDILDGNQAWYDIQAATGFSEDRCKELQFMFYQ